MSTPSPAPTPPTPEAIPKRMIGSDGLSYDVPPEQVQQAYEAGWRDETLEDRAAAQEKEEFGGPAGGVLAAGGGILGSIPFVGGALQKTLLPESPTAQKYHPFLSGAGKVGGTVAGVVATGGLGEALGVGGEALEGSSLLTRAAVRGAVGAAEGGLIYGPGQAVNDAVLNDHPLTAEYLLASARGGALLGGLLAGGLSVGGDAASAGLERIGNAARARTLARVVGADVGELEDAGLTTPRINDLYRDGTIRSGDTPVSVQSRLADKVGQLGQEIQQVGQRIDGSGQTFDIPAILKGAKITDEGYNNLVQLGDNAASFQRVAALRQSLSAQTSADAGTLADAIDSAIAEKAGAVEPALGERVGQLIDEHDSLTSLAKMADEAVAAQKSSVVGAKAGPLEALLRTGEHVATWGMLGHFAGSLLGGHAGLGMFLAQSGGNVLHEILENPAAIGEKFAAAQSGIAKAMGVTETQLTDAVTAAVERQWMSGGRSGGKLAANVAAERLMLPVGATASDVEDRRQQLQEMPPPARNGNPNLNDAVMRQRAVLAQALPQTPPPTLPQSLARRGDPGAKQVAVYNDAVRGITDPIGVLGGIGTGLATTARLQAVKAAYPALAARAGAALVNKSAASGETAHYALRQAISVLTGKPIDPAMAPAKIARIQALFQPQQPPGRGGAQPGSQQVRLNQKGLSSLDVAGRMNSLSQPAGKE